MRAVLPALRSTIVLRNTYSTIKRSYVVDPSNTGCFPMSTDSHPAGPIERAINERINETFEPVYLEVRNDSSKHAHHAPMRAAGGGSGETHFSVTIVSPLFKDISSIKRHRMVNQLFKSEFEMPNGVGIHALSLKLKTPEEWEKETGEVF